MIRPEGNMECEHIISNADDDCYSCLVTELREELKLVSEQRDLIAKKADKVEEHNAQLVEALNRSSELLTGIKAIEGLQLGGEQFPNLSDCHEQIEENGEALANQDPSWLEAKDKELANLQMMLDAERKVGDIHETENKQFQLELAELREDVEKAEKKRDHWESLWKKSSMSVIGLQESNKELDKLKGFLSVERNKVEEHNAQLVEAIVKINSIVEGQLKLGVISIQKIAVISDYALANQDPTPKGTGDSE